jgi:hypothetical protein
MCWRRRGFLGRLEHSHDFVIGPIAYQKLMGPVEQHFFPALGPQIAACSPTAFTWLSQLKMSLLRPHKK